jgi:hypothetical protein
MPASRCCNKTEVREGTRAHLERWVLVRNEYALCLIQKFKIIDSRVAHVKIVATAFQFNFTLIPPSGP